MSRKIPTSLYLDQPSLHCAEDLCFGLLALVSLTAVALAFNQTQRPTFAGSPSMAGQAINIVQQEANFVTRGIE